MNATSVRRRLQNSVHAGLKHRMFGALLGSLASVLACSAAAQAPGAPVTIPSNEQPVRGPGQTTFLPAREGATTWSSPQVSGPNVINPSPPGQLTMPTRSGLGQPEMTDAARWGLPSELLDSLHIVDFDRDGKRDVCGLVQLSAQGSPDFLCSHSLSPATVPLFAALVKRTGSVITLEKVVAGRLYDTPGTPRAMGFCWTTLTRSVSCSAEWR